MSLDQCWKFCADVCSSICAPDSKKTNCVIKNGEFVSLDGWTAVYETGTPDNATWATQSTPTTALNGGLLIPFPPPAPAPNTYALWEANFGQPGSAVLYQDIKLPNICTKDPLVLSFDWYAATANLLTALTPQETMDFNLAPNFQFRVDLVPTCFTDWFGVASDQGILKNLVPPSVSGDLSIDENLSALTSAPWVNAHFDVSEFAGKRVRLAFRVVSASCFNDSLIVGVANARVTCGLKHVFGPGITVPASGVAPLTPCTTPPAPKSQPKSGKRAQRKRHRK